MLSLYDYQRAAIDAAAAAMAEGSHPVLDIATGGGKSAIAAVAAVEALESRFASRVLITCPTRELVVQNEAAFRQFTDFRGVGVACSGLRRVELGRPVLIGTAATLINHTHALSDIDLAIVDEAHIGVADGSRMLPGVLASLAGPMTSRVGLSATPYTMKGGYLWDIPNAPFDTLAYQISTLKLIKLGRLCRVRSSEARLKLDTKGVHTGANGDFALGELAACCDQDDLNTQVVEEVMKRAADECRQSVMVFAINREHAKHLAEKFEEAGERCEYVDGSVDSLSRSAALRRFSEGETRYIVSIAALTTGVNIPRVDMIALVRPTQSTSLFVQIVGRGLRVWPGKEYLRVLDFGNNLALHGRPEMPRVFHVGESRRNPPKDPEPFFDSILDEIFAEPDEDEDAIRIAEIIDLDELDPDSEGRTDPVVLPEGYQPVDGISWRVAVRKQTGRYALAATIKTGGSRVTVYKPVLEQDGTRCVPAIAAHANALLRQLTPNGALTLSRFNSVRGVGALQGFARWLNGLPAPAGVLFSETGGYREVTGSIFPNEPKTRAAAA